jgi:putative tryptophan/tyrosine transport system substrate-binding protein
VNIARPRVTLVAVRLADLVGRKIDVITGTGGDAATLAAKNPISRIPVVFITGTDPVEPGLLASFAWPDGNLTASPS